MVTNDTSPYELLDLVVHDRVALPLVIRGRPVRLSRQAMRRGWDEGIDGADGVRVTSVAGSVLAVALLTRVEARGVERLEVGSDGRVSLFCGAAMKLLLAIEGGLSWRGMLVPGWHVGIG